MGLRTSIVVKSSGDIQKFKEHGAQSAVAKSAAALLEKVIAADPTEAPYAKEKADGAGAPPVSLGSSGSPQQQPPAAAVATAEAPKENKAEVAEAGEAPEAEAKKE